MQVRRVLVLGSSGQIGRPLSKFLTSHGKEVIEYDYVESINFDLRLPNSAYLDYSIRESDFVYFLAFDVGGSKYLQNYEKTFDFLNNNMKIMQNVFDSLNKYKKPFIFASSQMSNMAFSPYGSLKSTGEHFTSALGGVVTKFWNVYGSEKDPEKFHVISDFVMKAKRFGKINMNTDGSEVRDFLYVEDCCEALFSLMNNYNSFVKVRSFDIASFEWTSIINVAEIVSKLLSAEVIPSPRKDVVQKGVINSPSKDILEIWEPKTKLKHGIERVIQDMTDL